jgi:hypothetical protein
VLEIEKLRSASLQRFATFLMDDRSYLVAIAVAQVALETLIPGVVAVPMIALDIAQDSCRE